MAALMDCVENSVGADIKREGEDKNQKCNVEQPCFLGYLFLLFLSVLFSQHNSLHFLEQCWFFGCFRMHEWNFDEIAALIARRRQSL